MSDPDFLLAENQRLKAELDQVRNQIFPQMRTLLGQLERLKGERKNMRTLLSSIYLAGDGLEVGALTRPLPTSAEANVRYVDRMDVPSLREQYPELANMELVEVDIIDDGERLDTIPDGSQDFIIANHFLEHCRDPIGTIERLLTKLKPRGGEAQSSGVLYLAVPDKHQCFDRDRPLTSWDHVLADYRASEDERDPLDCPHFLEFATAVNGLEGEEATEAAQRLVDMDYSIHFHVWDLHSFLSFLLQTAALLEGRFEIIQFVQAGDEIIALLGKTG